MSQNFKKGRFSFAASTMSAFHPLILAFLILALLASIVLLTGTLEASAGVLKWRGKAPVQIKVIDKTPASWDSAVSAAVSNWNLSKSIHYTKEDASEDCRVVEGAVVICARNDGPTYYAALTTWGQRGNSLTAVLVVVNTFYVPTPNQFVFCHELGHALGLSHQDTAIDSCMSHNWGALYPNTEDYQQLESIY